MSKKTKRRSSKKRIHKNNSKKKPRKYKYSKNKYSKKKPSKYKYTKKRNFKGGADDPDNPEQRRASFITKARLNPEEAGSLFDSLEVKEAELEEKEAKLQEKDEDLVKAKEFGLTLVGRIEEIQEIVNNLEDDIVNAEAKSAEHEYRTQELDQDIIKLTDDNELKDRLIASNEADRDEEIMSIGSILGLNIRPQQDESLKEALIRIVLKKITELKKNQRDPKEIERLLARHAQALMEAKDELDRARLSTRKNEQELKEGKADEVKHRQKSDENLRDETAKYKRELERIGGPLKQELAAGRKMIGELEAASTLKDKMDKDRLNIIKDLQLRLQMSQSNPDTTNDQLESDNDKLREENDLLRQINEVQDYDCLTKLSTVLPK